MHVWFLKIACVHEVGMHVMWYDVDPMSNKLCSLYMAVIADIIVVMVLQQKCVIETKVTKSMRGKPDDELTDACMF